MSIIIDLEKINISDIRVGMPIPNDDGMCIYPIRYGSDAKELIIKFPRTRAPFGINEKAKLLSLSLGEKFNENPVYLKLMELDAFFGGIVENISDATYKSLVEFSMSKNKDGNLVINNKYGPHYNLSVFKYKNLYKFLVDGEDKNTFDDIDVMGFVHPGASLKCAAKLTSMVLKADGEVVIRPKLLKVKVIEMEDINMEEEQKAITEFQDLVL